MEQPTPSSSQVFLGISSGTGSSASQELLFDTDESPSFLEEGETDQANNEEEVASSLGKVRFKCAICSSHLKSDHGLKKHEERHKKVENLRDCAKRMPDVESVLLEVPDLADEVLLEIARQPAHSSFAKKIGAYCQNIFDTKSENWLFWVRNLATDLWDHISASSHLLPIVDREATLRSRAEFLGNSTVRERLQIELFGFHPEDTDVIRMFVYDFCVKLSDKMVLLILKELNPHSGERHPKTYVSSDSERSTLHYVCGFILRMYLKRARSYKNDSNWSAIYRCIVNNFIENSEQRCSPSFEDVKLWTLSLSRGGLVVVTQTAFEFFCLLNDIISTLCADKPGQEIDISAEVVINEVYKSQKVICAWDAVVGSSYFSPMGSLHFMEMIIKSFSNLSGFAMAKRDKENILSRNPQDAAIRKHLLK